MARCVDWARKERIAHHGLGRKCDESESSGSLGVGVAHDDDVGQLAELRVELSHGVVGGVGREAADEDLAEVLRLGGVGGILLNFGWSGDRAGGRRRNLPKKKPRLHSRYPQP